MSNDEFARLDEDGTAKPKSRLVNTAQGRGESETTIAIVPGPADTYVSEDGERIPLCSAEPRCTGTFAVQSDIPFLRRCHRPSGHPEECGFWEQVDERDSADDPPVGSGIDPFVWRRMPENLRRDVPGYCSNEAQPSWTASLDATWDNAIEACVAIVERDVSNGHIEHHLVETFRALRRRERATPCDGPCAEFDRTAPRVGDIRVLNSGDASKLEALHIELAALRKVAEVAERVRETLGKNDIRETQVGFGTYVVLSNALEAWRASAKATQEGT